MDQIFRIAPARAPEDALGAASLAIWSLTLVVAVQYSMLVLRAQNDGEGGVFALYGLLHEPRRTHPSRDADLHRKDRRVRMLLWALIAGAGLLIGDGMITPAISVLSAVEGLAVAAPGFAGAVIPVTVGLLIALFAIQVKGASAEARAQPRNFFPPTPPSTTLSTSNAISLQPKRPRASRYGDGHVADGSRSGLTSADTSRSSYGNVTEPQGVIRITDGRPGQAVCSNPTKDEPNVANSKSDSRGGSWKR